MFKLIAQMVVLAGLLGLARAKGLGVPATIGLLLLGILAVHLVFETLFGYRPGNPVSIRNDDPLLLEALESAKSHWPYFLALHAERPQNCVVKFKIPTSQGIENVWGDLLSMDDKEAIVQVLTPPSGTPDVTESPKRTISISEIVDWQVVFDDETLCGGFTQQAVFRIIERDTGTLPEKYAKELLRYRPIPTDGV